MLVTRLGYVARIKFMGCPTSLALFKSCFLSISIIQRKQQKNHGFIPDLQSLIFYPRPGSRCQEQKLQPQNLLFLKTMHHIYFQSYNYEHESLKSTNRVKTTVTTLIPTLVSYVLFKMCAPNMYTHATHLHSQTFDTVSHEIQIMTQNSCSTCFKLSYQCWNYRPEPLYSSFYSPHSLPLLKAGYRLEILELTIDQT